MKIISNLVEAHIVRKVNNNLEFLLLKRANHETYAGIWQMVTGSINEDETAYETAAREIKEETGLSIKKLWVVPRINSFYYPKNDSVCLVPVFATLIDENLDINISAEHSEFMWVKKNEAITMLAWDGQRKSVELIEEYLTNKSSAIHFNEIELK
ncbi:MAG: NUDIX pyrophosphatase [Melioribacteraceae bacterium]|nr:NUDIX pyrophosphatase [Melioribacteraceae bacterium]MCO6472622.1 NUDIX pyrophosphatase [Melioribacteraceae bacterium]MDD3557864.1 NUDIX pyrophosphatase [Melioribacteraceae bacterium]